MKNLSKMISDDLEKQLYEERRLLASLLLIFLFFLIAPFLIPPFKQGSTTKALQVILLGAVASSIYMIIALGFSLIYGVAKQLKLSLGGYYVVGAYCMFFLLETMKITPNMSRFEEGLDGLLLVALILLPIVLMVVLLAFFWTVFDITEFIFVGASGIIAGASVIVFGGMSDGNNFGAFLVEGFYAGLAVFTLGLAAWYLELSKREVAFGTFILGCAYPVMFAVEELTGIEFPAVFISLAILSILFTASLAMLS
ncbi:MAG: ABC transporter permease subunit, partial [Candidatus Hodarchaeales archaeon]